MSVFRSAFSCTKNMAMASRITSQQRLLPSSLGLRCAGQRNLTQVAAVSPLTASRSLTHNLLRTSVCLSQKRFVQTKSDTEMSEFLRGEIQAEKEQLKATGKAVQVKGFDVETNDAEVTFKKKFGSEDIKVTVNVNHAVDADHNDLEEAVGKAEEAPGMTKMVCKPNFEVQIIKNGTILGFNCAMAQEDEMEEEDDAVNRQGADGEQYRDQFNIEEFSIYKGEFKDSVYVMSGEIMDGSFYDNLMNMLDERGINSEFVQQVVDFSTLYEQKLYVNMLEHLQDIVKAK